MLGANGVLKRWRCTSDGAGCAGALRGTAGMSCRGQDCIAVWGMAVGLPMEHGAGTCGAGGGKPGGEVGAKAARAASC